MALGDHPTEDAPAVRRTPSSPTRTCPSTTQSLSPLGSRERTLKALEAEGGGELGVDVVVVVGVGEGGVEARAH